MVLVYYTAQRSSRNIYLTPRSPTSQKKARIIFMTKNLIMYANEFRITNFSVHSYDIRIGIVSNILQNQY